MNIFESFREDINDLDITIQREIYVQFKKLVSKEISKYINDDFQKEDVIQMSFLKALLYGPKLRENSNTIAWLKIIAKNTAIDNLRKTSKIIKHEFIGTDFFQLSQKTEPQSIINSMYEQDKNEMLHFCINQLSIDEQALIKNHYFNGKPYAQLQKETGVSESILTQRMSRTRKKLSKSLIITVRNS